jgi:GntR family transcriptional regulator
LPAQQDLAERYGVTLMTLRQAVARLEADGLVWTSRGRGSFVADQPVTYRIGNLSSFADQMRVQGLELVTEVLSIGPPKGDVAEVRRALALVRAPLVEIHRLRLVQGRPVVSQRTFLPGSLAASLDLDALGEVSLYDLIAETTGRRVARARESLRAVALAAEDAALLDQPVGAPALESVRTSLTVDRTPFLNDRAVLVAEAASVEADRTADSLDLVYRLNLPQTRP